MKVLHVAAEIFPLVKTGGLADVTGAILPWLNQRGIDARIVLPGFPAILDGVRQQKKIAEMGPAFGAAQIAIRQGRMPVSGVQVYIVDAPWLFNRPGNPYVGADGNGWSDNPRRCYMVGCRSHRGIARCHRSSARRNRRRRRIALRSVR